ncbi:MAG: hypothetical protein FJX29_11680 [Alphaproteobacteria bacterium]|nr:hypothetical protein [Alphaproteobacteria bacterium]
MDRRYALALIASGFAGLACPGAARAAQSASVPAWKPGLGKRLEWKTTFENRISRDGAQEWSQNSYVLTQAMTVLARTLDGYSILWELEPPAGNSHDENGYAFLMSAYGLRQIVTGTDLAGMPLRTYGAAAMRERLEQLAAERRERDPNGARVLEEVLEKSESDDRFEAGAFVSASMLIGRLQRAQDWQASEGGAFNLQQLDYFQGELRLGDARMKVEKIDTETRRINLSWVWDFPRESFPNWLSEHVSAQLARNEQLVRILPGPLREAAVSAGARYSGTAAVSLDDGALISASERRVLRVGNDSTIAVLSTERS